MPAAETTASFDYVIVGAGSAGCVLANRLSADGRHQVLLLEAGGKASHPATKVPVAWLQAAMNPAIGWGYMSEPEPGLDGRRLPHPRGRLIGGTSSINGMMYTRGQAADYDGWRDAGLTGWGYADVLPYFRRSEDSSRGAGPYHGVGGPLHVQRHPTEPRLFAAFMAAVQGLGYKAEDDFNVPMPDGFGIPDFTIRNGRRESSYTAFLRPVHARPNLAVITGAQVDRVLLTDGAATGVAYRTASGPAVAQAGEVLLCGGAFNSPHLLLLSGIGPGPALQQQGIAVARHLPGVGQDLQDHPMIHVGYTAKGDVTFERQLRLDRLGRAALQWLLLRRGPLVDMPMSIQGFLRSTPELDRPDLQLQVSHTSMMARPWFPGVRRGVGHQFSAGSLLLRPRSRGSVTLGSPDPSAPPRILFNVLQADEDGLAMRRSLRLMRALFAAPALRDLVQDEIMPGRDCTRDDELDGFIRQTLMTGAHPTSSCRMGCDAKAVVDARLRVHGVGRLRVVDAAVMPAVVSGNTNAPTIMIAEKASDMILGRSPPT